MNDNSFVVDKMGVSNGGKLLKLLTLWRNLGYTAPIYRRGKGIQEHERIEEADF
jgi:hypothetical protein